MKFEFDTLEKMILATAEAIRPPERLTVSQSATKYRYLNNPGSYIGPWLNEKTPYLIEPMDELTSTDYTGMVFVGPARSGKSDMFFNFLTHTAICDPADMMVVQMSRASARDWSLGDLQKAFRHTTALGTKVIPGRQNMNVHDIRFISGMRLLIKWPTITELSGKTIPRLWLMDYDRMDEDIGGEGNAYDLAKKRSQTFGRYAMCVAESSPGYEVESPSWIAKTPHEAPPTKGILALYNRGDRRRFYWRCPACHNAFEPDFELLSYPASEDHVEAAEMATIDCPHCRYSLTHEPGPGQPGKHELNQVTLGNARWVKDGQKWTPRQKNEAEVGGRIEGVAARSDIASFWQKGVTAGFMSWSEIVLKYLKAMEEYENTNSFEALKVTMNVDQGKPFKAPSLNGELLPEVLKSRAKELEIRSVPEGVRFLIATVDIQSNRFEVQVQGFGIGGDVWIIDRFSIRKSERLDDDGERYPVKPGAHPEDWRLLVEGIIEKTYPLDDGSGRHMGIKVVGSDAYGGKGFTTSAYEFWRWLRDKQGANHHRRFQLIKGDHVKGAPRVQIRFPDAQQKDKHAAARGDIPVLHINTNIVKDQTANMLSRAEPGGGFVTFPNWLPDWFYTELTVEQRTTDKGWINPKSRRNEAWDLLVYSVALALSQHVRVEKIDWDDPPAWAAEWDDNALVFPAENKNPFAIEAEADTSALEALSKLAEALG